MARRKVRTIWGPLRALSYLSGGHLDRFAIFVDAGYLYAASGKLLFGTTDRKKFSLNFESIVNRLIALGEADCASLHLRTYWYDGARDAQPTAQHLWWRIFRA